MRLDGTQASGKDVQGNSVGFHDAGKFGNAVVVVLDVFENLVAEHHVEHIVRKRQGRCFVACGLFADPRGFRFEAETADGQAHMGEDISLQESPVLKVKSPAAGLIRFIHDGREIKAETGTEASLRPDKPGPYRVEVRLPRAFGKTRAWIFSNPIYVR